MLHAIFSGAILFFTPLAIGSDECLRLPPVVTSRVSIQAFWQYRTGGEVVPAAAVEVAVFARRKIASAKTDERGQLQFSSLPPGPYQLSMRHLPSGQMAFQDVRLVDRVSGPSKIIAVLFWPIAACARPCAVSGEGPLTKPPACVFGK